MDKLTEQLGPLFETELLKEISDYGRFQEFGEGEVILDYNKNIRAMPLVLSGSVRVMRKDEEGHEILLYYLGSSESCAMAYTCCMESRKSEIRAVADTPVEIISVPHEKLDDWLIRFPGWKSYIFHSFTVRFNELLKSLESVAFQKLDERLVRYLKNKTKASGKMVVSLSHHQIAEELGTNRVVVSRLLKILENEGKVILYRNELKVLQTL